MATVGLSWNFRPISLIRLFKLPDGPDHSRAHSGRPHLPLTWSAMRTTDRPGSPATGSRIHSAGRTRTGHADTSRHRRQRTPGPVRLRPTPAASLPRLPETIPQLRRCTADARRVSGPPAGSPDPMTARQPPGSVRHAGMPARLHTALPAVRTESQRAASGGQPEIVIGCA